MKKILILLLTLTFGATHFTAQASQPTPDSWYSSWIKPAFTIGSAVVGFVSLYCAKNYWNKCEVVNDLQDLTRHYANKNEFLPSDKSMFPHRMTMKYDIPYVQMRDNCTYNTMRELNDNCGNYTQETRKTIAQKYFPKDQLVEDSNGKPLSEEQIKKNINWVINKNMLGLLGFGTLGAASFYASYSTIKN